MQTSRFRLFPVRPRLALFPLVGMVVCGLCAALSTGYRKAPETLATAQVKNTNSALSLAKTRIENNLSLSNIALENSRQIAANSKKRAADQARHWATGAVLVGQRFARASERIASEQGLGAKDDDLPVKFAPVANSMGSKKDAAVITKQEAAVITNRENIAQFQSRSLYGALELRDDQWRQVDRTLAGYYQEGFTRHLDGRDRPRTGIDTWQQQRAELSRRAYLAVNARLDSEQAARFQSLYQNDNWLWAIESSL